ncbi:unnamed protein product [Pipistrellus nathusii]|uniref:Uncharacterized protein n=1 Tax=Pipistrellus nathusii TaxID=59473 RepID=A0ABN9Z6K5_PIPNA
MLECSGHEYRGGKICETAAKIHSAILLILLTVFISIKSLNSSLSEAMQFFNILVSHLPNKVLRRSENTNIQRVLFERLFCAVSKNFIFKCSSTEKPNIVLYGCFFFLPKWLTPKLTSCRIISL